MDQPRSTLFDATAAVLFPGVVGSLELFPFPNESLEIRSGENPPRTTSWARFLLLDADSFKSVRLPCFLLLHTVASLLLFQGPPPPARSMAASAVIALTAFSTLGAATLASPYSYGRFPCSVWGSDNRLHGGEPFRQVSHRLVSSLARARKALHVPPRPTETLAWRTALIRSCRTHRRLALRAQQARRDGLDDLFHLRLLRLQARRFGTDRRHLHAGQRVWELVVRYRGCDLHQRRGLRQRTLHRRTMVSADRQDLSSLKSVR